MLRSSRKLYVYTNPSARAGKWKRNMTREWRETAAPQQTHYRLLRSNTTVTPSELHFLQSLIAVIDRVRRKAKNSPIDLRWFRIVLNAVWEAIIPITS